LQSPAPWQRRPADLRPFDHRYDRNVR